MNQTLTHSMLSTFRACPRRCEIAYELGIRTIETSFPLRVGSAFHAALEAADKGIDYVPELADPFDLALVAAMVNGHAARWPEPIEVIAAELEFALNLGDTEWTLAGKIDRIVRLSDGRMAIQEYKTTSRDFSPGADYWLALQMDQQLSIYVIAARALGYPVETILFDVTRRPAQRPLKKTAEIRIKKDGTPYAGQRLEDETPEEFVARVSADIAERPEHYFARIEIARLDDDLADCHAEIWQQMAAIQNARNDGLWYRNPNSCTQPYTCEFLSICRNRDLATSTPAGFRRVENPHQELTATPGASPACSPEASPATSTIGV